MTVESESRAPTRRVVVVYSRVGGGHQSAARALAAALEQAGGGRVRAHAADIYLEQSRFPVNRFPALYARLARYHPRLWYALFYSTNGGRFDATPLLRPFMAGVHRLLAQEQPDLIVSVMPVVNGLLAQAAARRNPRPRFEVVLTDWCDIHRTWLAPGVDHYTVPTKPAAQDCVRFGVPPEKVDVIGLPVRAEFAVGPPGSADRARVWASMELDPDRFTVLMMVGAEGSPRSLRNLEALCRLDFDGQLVAICGRNERLRAQVERLPSQVPRRVLGFVDNVADLMRGADLLVTKAGGMTLAEAFCCAVPVIVHDILPGQERGNTSYALEHGAVEYAETAVQLVRLVLELRASPERRAALAASARVLACPAAAPRIAAAMLERLGRS